MKYLINQSVIELNDAVLINAGWPLFHPVSFSLTNGDALLLSGRSGIGKTSLLRSLLGLSTPFLIEGSMRLKNPAGYAPQSLDLWPHLSTFQTLQIVQRSAQSLPWIHELLLGFALDKCKDVPAKKLSGGEKQRLNLARSMVLKPSLLIWDEPFSSQDRYTKEKLIIFIKQYLTSLNASLLFVCHDEKEGKLLANREEMLKASIRCEAS